MSPLAAHLENYLTIRRGLGFKLINEGRMLNDFVAFADAAGEPTITIETALLWAKQPKHGCHAYLSQRMRAIRGLARYLHGLDPSCEVAPLDLLPAPQAPADAPHLHRPGDRRSDRGGSAAATANARSGVRDPDRTARLHRQPHRRSVPPRPPRHRLGQPAPRDPRFEVRENARGAPAHQHNTGPRRLRRDPRSAASDRRSAQRVPLHPRHQARASDVQPDLPRCSARRGSRAHPAAASAADARSAPFAVKTLLGWYRDGADVAARMPLLSKYLGHVDPVATYWYLSASPELLGLAARRLELANEDRASDKGSLSVPWAGQRSSRAHRQRMAR